MKTKKILFSLCALLSVCSCGMVDGKTASPDGNIEMNVYVSDNTLSYNVLWEGDTVIGTSRLGIVIDGCDIGGKAEIKKVSKKEINEKYKTRGIHSNALNYANEYDFQILSNGMEYQIQTRVYDDGVAFRYIIPGNGLRTVNSETTEFSLEKNMPVWFFERKNDWKLKTYAGEWLKTVSDSLYCVSPNGPVQGKVLLYELGNERYLAVTEAALYDYSGMRLEARKDASLKVNFTENEGFKVNDTIVTPWRVIIMANGLNELVNTDIITNLNPDPDNELFNNDMSWIKPGRSVWSWWSYPDAYMTADYEKKMIDCAYLLGYEYTMLDEGWEKWNNKWDTLKDICNYAAQKNVGVWVWKHSDQIINPDNDYETMACFLDSVANAGCVGMKIDFMNGESKSIIDFDIRALEMCAERKLMVNFHGCQAPTGEYRRFPNELTREGIRGLELNKMDRCLSSNHNVALAFTRCILNNADYTPVGFSKPGKTTWAHQLATAYVFTSPLLVVAENPEILLNDLEIRPALPLLKAVPTVWDETIVLPESDIDGLVLMARRKGNEWFLLALSGKEGRDISLNASFLPDGEWNVYEVSDGQDNCKMNAKTYKCTSDSTITFKLNDNGGYVAHFIKNTDSL